ncbi:MAG: hypothetical protein IPK37_08330 [Austwickia sp.]|jgi:hypothetical protein|nr:MAG: hypothetical protein IPK37_08330 [Austwickia sp.]
MNALSRQTVYGRIVPALAILLGLSYAFIDNEGVHRALLFALVAAAALGWLFRGDCSTAEGVARDQRRAARREMRAERRSGGLPAQPGATPTDSANGPVGPVLNGVPQDTVPGEEQRR